MVITNKNMSTQKNKICLNCGKEIWSSSIRCKSCAKKSILNPFYGKKHSAESIKKISDKNHHNWKGNKAKYKAIHNWVNSHKGKPQVCQLCGKTNKETRIEWANKDHKYRRNLDDYFSLCCSCHLKYDLANGFKTYYPTKDPITGKFI